jgi:hypothetical protein
VKEQEKWKKEEKRKEKEKMNAKNDPVPVELVVRFRVLLDLQEGLEVRNRSQVPQVLVLGASPQALQQ